MALVSLTHKPAKSDEPNNKDQTMPILLVDGRTRELIFGSHAYGRYPLLRRYLQTEDQFNHGYQRQPLFAVGVH